ncbi:MAG: metal-dependent hydrolase [Acidobacteria bacterium]|nr:metal-dependent hydrolase [Acidobacteriota bacterium]
MDTISTGIGGALLAKALPEDWRGPKGVAAVTLASVLPDADVLANFFVTDQLARIAQHRSFTHSLVGVAVMAPLLAVLLWRFTRDKNYWRLLALSAYGMLWHLFTDLATSWGTQIWYPFNRERVAWDLIFILDFIFTGILLLPQLVAWTYKEPARTRKRGAVLWLLLTSFTALVIALASPFFGVGFQWGLFALLSIGLAALFLAPAVKGWGFQQNAAAFARIGVAALVVYVGVCTVAHWVAVQRVEQWLRQKPARLDMLPCGPDALARAAVPQPLSPFRWTGLALAEEGVCQSWFNVWDEDPPAFEFFPSENNEWVVRARELPQAKEYLWFARFPVARYRREGGRHIVEYTDRRFQSVRARGPAFNFRVVFNDRGEMLHAGFPLPDD